MRREFPAKIKAAAFERCGGHCEQCTAPIRYGAQYDHRVPDALGGEPTLTNCRVLCKTCHGLKTTQEDVPRIAKVKRVRGKHINANDKRGGFRKPPDGYNAWTRRIEG